MGQGCNSGYQSQSLLSESSDFDQRLALWDRGAEVYKTNCAQCHGELAVSVKRDRYKEQILTAIEQVPTMQFLSGLTANDIAALEIALTQNRPVFGEAEDIKVSPFLCTTPEEGLSNLKRLSRTEYLNTVIDLMNGSVTLEDINFEAELIASECFSLFATNFLAKVYRKDLSPVELQTVRTQFDAFNGEESWARLKFITDIALQSPNFIFHLETAGDQVSSTTLKISSFELANRISYLAWKSMPDDELFAAARNGGLDDPQQLALQLDRVFSTPKADNNIREFYNQWLELNKFPSLTYSNLFLGGIQTNGLRDKLLEDLFDFVLDVNETGTYQDLILSKKAFIKTPELAQIYGQAQGAGDGSVELTGSDRTGLLSRPAMLLSGADSNRPIHRGVIVKRNLLCDEIPNPNPDDFADPSVLMSPATSVELSLRDEIERRTSPAQCMTCHSRINPPAFALENFDSLGRFRTDERVISDDQIVAMHRVNASVQRPSLNSPDDPAIDGAEELSELIAAGSSGAACMVRKWFTYSRKRSPSSKDACSMDHMYKSLTSTNYPNSTNQTPATIKNMLMSEATAESFMKRKIAEDE